MPKFTLIAEHLDDNGGIESRVIHEFDRDYLPEVVMMMQEFLRGVGFYFDGELQIFDENEGKRVCENGYEHSDCFWDTDRNR